MPASAPLSSLRHLAAAATTLLVTREKGKGRREKREGNRDKAFYPSAFYLLPSALVGPYGRATVIRFMAPPSTRDRATVRLASSRSSCSMPFMEATVS